MCGVLVAFSKKEPLNESNCLKATEKIFSRGPDFNFSRFRLNNKLYLSQTVLSVTGNFELNLDYTVSKNKRYEILFNGEIYNFKELQSKYLDNNGLPNLSSSDTETLINLHQVFDPVTVRKLIKGMFAYVIYDSVEKKLLISRDIIGEKVMYKYEDDNLLIFSSQIGPILEIGKNIKFNKKVLKNYFFTRHLLTENETVYKNIEVFRPGQTIEINLESFNLKSLHSEDLISLFDKNLLNENIKKSNNDLLIEADNIMKENVQFLYPEIDYYSVVSGGIDSSLVSKYLSDYSVNNLNFICLQFPGKDDVASGVKLFEKYLKNNISQIKVDIDLFQNYISECYKSICMPLPTHSFISQAILAREVNQRGAKILFTGDGGDELFGGYEFYKTLNYDNQFDYNPSVYSGVVDYDVRFRNYDHNELLIKSSEIWKDTTRHFESFGSIEANIQSILLLDTKIQLESVGIRASDTMSLMSSVETRGFFLTLNMLRFAINLPADSKIRISKNEIYTRPLMKNLFSKKFNKSLLKPKQGFSGYPNESVKNFIDNYDISREYLEIENFEKLDIKNNLSLEWKFLNTEYFLKTFQDYAK